MELNHKKILVTFLMHLGDLTLTTPFIRALRQAAPDSHITMLVDEKLKDVVLHNPCLDEVITIDKHGRDNSVIWGSNTGYFRRSTNKIVSNVAQFICNLQAHHVTAVTEDKC